MMYFRPYTIPITLTGMIRQITRQFVNQSFWLYEKLLKPALSQFSHAKELILIPDGKLCYLPFEALISERPENLSEVNYEKLKYLLA